MQLLEVWSASVPLIALAVPATLGLVGLTCPGRAGMGSSGALALALAFTVSAALTSGAYPSHPALAGVRVDVVTCVMLLLVAGLGTIVVRYSLTYLQGERELTRYLRWLLLTLSAVTALVIANNLLVVALGWVSTSLALHQLLTFYRDRTHALVAAHKKFLVSRFADVCLLGCLALIYHEVGSLDLDRIAAWAGSHDEPSTSMQLAAVLLVIAVALRSAQLPFHGWLIQVMEAPTPVSALLHAGVVNIGGFVLIRVASFIAQVAVAQVLLVVVGLVTASVAALVMTTRISVKVALAWSTCAQMGFMLVQCGLGLWQLALLHLVAHSLYKAHAFSSAGTAVGEWRLRALTSRPPEYSWVRLSVSVSVAAGCAAFWLTASRTRLSALWPGDELAVAALCLVLSLSLVPLIARETFGLASTAATAARASGVILLYVGWHAVATQLMPVPFSGTHSVGWVLASTGLMALFAVKATLQVRPDGRLARALYPWLFAGFYLDDYFTRLTFRVWPPRLRQQTGVRRASPILDISEARA